MSTIISEVYDAFIDAGTTEEKAKAAAAVIPTRANITDVETSLLNQMSVVNKRLGKLEVDLGKVKEDLGKVKEDVAVVKAVLAYLYGPIIIGLLVKIAFF